MKKDEIVKAFFKKGCLLTPDALEFLEKAKDFKKILDYIESENFVLSLDDFINFEVPRIEKIKILKNLNEIPENLTTKEFLSFFLSKYDACKKIIEERIKQKYTSISSVSENQKNVWIIGMVRDIHTFDEKIYIEIDDPTGSIGVEFEKKIFDENVKLDDVIVLNGDIVKKDDKKIIIGKKILWPDVPLRTPTKGYGRICVISDIHLNEAPITPFIEFLKWFNEQDIEYLFILGDIGDKKKFEELINEYVIREKNIFIIPGEIDDKRYPGLPIQFNNEHIISLSNPSIIELNDVKILLIHKFDILMLKKRYLGSSNYILKKDFLVMDVLPDIIVCGHSHNQEIINYKSITIINPGSLLTEFTPTIVDLETREYEQLRF